MARLADAVESRGAAQAPQLGQAAPTDSEGNHRSAFQHANTNDSAGPSLGDLLAAHPGLEDLLRRLALTMTAGRDGPAVEPPTPKCNTSGQSPSDNSIAAEKDFSPTPKEEPMYTWVSPKPYKHFKKWRVWFRGLDGQRDHRTFENEFAACAFIEKAKTELLVDGGHPIQDVIREYLKTRESSLKPSSIQTLDFRLRTLIDKRNAVPIEVFPWMKAWGEHVAKQSTDSQHGIRAAAKGLIGFCIKAGLLRKDPLAEVEISGKKRRGKTQLHIDEAKRFVDVALQTPHDPLAVACAAMVFTGLRPGEIMNLRVRDLDAGGTILWVEESKTEASRRGVEVAVVFRPYLMAMACGRGSMEYLFSYEPQRQRSSKDERKQRVDALLRRTRLLCKTAGLPVVCSHSMRGLHSTLATGVGITGHAVAKALGHTSFAVTKRHYVDPDVLQNAALRSTLGMLIAPLAEAAQR
jgi:integrase